MRSLISTLVFALPLPVQAAPPVCSTRPEIDALLDTLLASGYEFNRNGSWYASRAAKGHLGCKPASLEGRQTVTSTEQ
ncbi:MAG TPA: DUF5329 family protein, partial [Rhodocyclaceae bacterium]|nr:DUF5329 family protein [Rhodocyclaceae bacterium]